MRFLRLFSSVVFAIVVLADSAAAAGPLCALFGECFYEGVPFTIRVVDAETGGPLADVHALAAWVQHGMHGQGGPVMVQDAVSGPDGLLHFPAWGPLQGSSGGLILGDDPIITLFKPGYLLPRPFPGGARVISNRYPAGTKETTQVRRFGQDGQTFPMDPFRGTTKEWLDEILSLAWASGSSSSEFHDATMHRLRRVRAEVQTIRPESRDMENKIRAFERSFLYVEGLYK